MSAIRYLGYFDTLAEGKFLIEILAQLRGFGVGRLVTKSEWQRRWPDEPSYLRVIQVQARMDRWLRHGRVIGEWHLRGHKLGVYDFSRDLDRPDWKLIHKHDEHSFVDFQATKKLEVRRPSKVPLPKLQQLLAKEYADRVPDSLPNGVLLDREHEYLSPYVRLDEQLNSAESIYDVDASIYLDTQYGRQLPTKMDKYDVIDRTAVAGDPHLEKPQDIDDAKQSVQFIK